eukprot:403349437
MKIMIKLHFKLKHLIAQKAKKILSIYSQPRSQLSMILKGNLLAKYQMHNIFKGSRLFDQKSQLKVANNGGSGNTAKAGAVSNMEQDKQQQKSQETQDQQTATNTPQLVFAYVHSPTVEIGINKPVQLDHFHYRINQRHRLNYIEQQNDYIEKMKSEGKSLEDFKVQEFKYYIRTYDNGRIIHDIELKPDQTNWQKVTFPRSKVKINRIIISQGVELDNISLNYYLKVKQLLSFWVLEGIPAINLSGDDTKQIWHASISDIKQGFREYEQVGNTLEFIGDMVYLFQLEKNYLEYLNPELSSQTNIQSKPKSGKKGSLQSINVQGNKALTDSEIQAKQQQQLISLSNSLVEGLKYLEHQGTTVMYRVKNMLLNQGDNGEGIEMNLQVAMSQRLLSNEEIINVIRTFCKFKRTSANNQKQADASADIKLQTFTEEQLQKDIELVGKLEDFCSSGEFTQLMQEFGENHCMSFEGTEEQNIECYQIYKEYCKLLDSKLDEFLLKEGIVADDMYKSCQRVQQMDSQSLMCLDWILASLDYIEFVTMMLQFRDAKEWNYEDYGQEEEEQQS